MTLHSIPNQYVSNYFIISVFYWLPYSSCLKIQDYVDSCFYTAAKAKKKQKQSARSTEMLTPVACV
jgi:hypothetical protein